jgi:hypothetical protein
MKKILMMVFLMVAYSAAFCQVPVAYSNADYTGAAVGLNASYPSLDGYRCQANWNQHIAAIKIPDGWKVEIFEGPNYTGGSMTLTSDVSNMSSIGWSDRISSIRVSRSNILVDGVCPCLKKAPIMGNRPAR